MTAEHSPTNNETSGSTSARSSFTLLLGVLITAALVIGLTVLIPKLLSPRSYSPTAHPAVGRQVEQIHLQPLTGADKPLTMPDIAGRVVIMNFWGTWCPPCRLEMPHLVEWYRELRREQDTVLISVSCDDNLELAELARSTEQYLERNRFDDLPTYADPQGATRRHIAHIAGFGASFAYPTTIVLDRGGVIRGVWVGVSEQGAEATMNEQRALVDALHQPTT